MSSGVIAVATLMHSALTGHLSALSSWMLPNQNAMALKQLIDLPRMKLRLSSSPASAPHRQENEQRIRALKPGTADMAAWPDDEVAELRQSLEQVAKRRASGFAIPVHEVA